MKKKKKTVYAVFYFTETGADYKASPSFKEPIEATAWEKLYRSERMKRPNTSCEIRKITY